MKEHTQAIYDDMEQLAEDARGLFVATADIAGDAVTDARKKLGEALERGKQMARNIENDAVSNTRCTMNYLSDHRYQAIVIGLSIGAIIGCLFACRPARKQG
jgi:ElaB/YqjD/DUF883 family membrane-anchored ribosome-binding protein